MNNHAEKRAVIFGAGKVAGGLLGQVLAASGYDILLIARRPEVIEAINRHRGYRLTVAGERAEHRTIRGCAALSIADHARVAAAVADADVVFTAVGVDNLADIAPAIAAGLWRRGQRPCAAPLNVIACENLPGAGAYLRQQILDAADPRASLVVDAIGGFAAALTHRIMIGGGVERGALAFTVNTVGGAYDLVIDAHGLKGAPPVLRGASLADDFPAMVRRKLFLLNCAHATAAYLGYREGCRYVHEAMAHPRVAPVVRSALAEARDALAAKYPAQAAAIAREAAAVLVCIADPHLADEIVRVARDPRRKLSPRERLVGPARLAAKRGLPYEHLARAIAAALAYDHPGDAQATAMQRAIASDGVERVLTEDCGLLPYDPLAQMVKRQLTLIADRPMRAEPGVVPALERTMRSLVLRLSERYGSASVNVALAHMARECQESPDQPVTVRALRPPVQLRDAYLRAAGM